MSISLEWLSGLPIKEQERILKSLSKKDINPIEVDGAIYYIPKAVAGLIDSLWEQLEKTKEPSNGVTKN
jgi:hypothetical protein